MRNRYADCISLSPQQNVAMPPITSDLETLGGRVSFLRQLKGWSQKDLARLCDFSQPTIWALEHNETKEVSARLLWAVASALETTADYLWTGELNADEAVLLAAFRKLKPQEQSIVMRAAGVDGSDLVESAKRKR